MGKGRIIFRPTSMLRKQLGQFNKLFGLWENSNKNKLPVKPPVQTDGVPIFWMASKGIRTKHITRRQVVMTRHFTEIISDILANNLRKQLTDIGITITNIESKAWNKGVNVYYKTNFNFRKSLEDELSPIVGQLRYAISERRLIGRTPLVNFVYDETADLAKNLESIFQVTRKNQSDKVDDLTETSSNQVEPSKSAHKISSGDVKGLRFSAPGDMSNTILGLNYPSLYDEVATKLERGRGQSDRMISNVSLASASIPYIRGPPVDNDEEDPTKRILQMQKFLISQKKKTEYLSKKRRMEELLARDRVKWDWPESEDQDNNDDKVSDEDNYKDLTIS